MGTIVALPVAIPSPAREALPERDAGATPASLAIGSGTSLQFDQSSFDGALLLMEDAATRLNTTETNAAKVVDSTLRTVLVAMEERRAMAQRIAELEARIAELETFKARALAKLRESRDVMSALKVQLAALRTPAPSAAGPDAGTLRLLKRVSDMLAQLQRR